MEDYKKTLIFLALIIFGKSQVKTHGCVHATIGWRVQNVMGGGYQNCWCIKYTFRGVSNKHSWKYVHIQEENHISWYLLSINLQQ